MNYTQFRNIEIQEQSGTFIRHFQFQEHLQVAFRNIEIRLNSGTFRNLKVTFKFRNIYVMLKFRNMKVIWYSGTFRSSFVFRNIDITLNSETLKFRNNQEHLSHFQFLGTFASHIGIQKHRSCGVDVQNNSGTLRILEITFKFRNMSHRQSGAQMLLLISSNIQEQLCIFRNIKITFNSETLNFRNNQKHLRHFQFQEHLHHI